MNKHYKRNMGLKQCAYFLWISMLLFSMAACSKMDSTYHDFWNNGEKRYPAAPDSLKIYPGKDRVELRWVILGDPSITKAKIFWNNGTDSLIVPIQRKGASSIDTINVILKDMPEGFYSFNIYTYDNEGNRSVEASAVGQVYGDSYSNSLLARIVNGASFINDTLRIIWGDHADPTSIGSEIDYTDTLGVSRQLYVASDADTTSIADYNPNISHYITYRTLFLPDSMAIDTFYAKYDSVKVLGPRSILPKTGWTATASSYDQRHGTARAPQAAIDNNIATIWVNQISPQTHFPHTITVDMGSVQDNIYGISFYLDKRNETPKSVDIYISNDGANWQLLGLFTLQNETGIQYVDFPQPESLLYFRVKTEQPQGNTPNIVIPEVGVFTR